MGNKLHTVNTSGREPHNTHYINGLQCSKCATNWRETIKVVVAVPNTLLCLRMELSPIQYIHNNVSLEKSTLPRWKAAACLGVVQDVALMLWANAAQLNRDLIDVLDYFNDTGSEPQRPGYLSNVTGSGSH